jgi:hypothetical protein
MLPCLIGREAWIAIWSAVQAVGTIAATGVAAYQIHALRRDQKAWRTLEACERYERDPTLTKICERLRDARDKGELDKNPRPFRLEASTLLNYCDGIAIGVIQSFTSKELSRIILSQSFETTSRNFCRSKWPLGSGLTQNHSLD